MEQVSPSINIDDLEPLAWGIMAWQGAFSGG
jgi:hypothetical protein